MPTNHAATCVTPASPWWDVVVGSQLEFFGGRGPGYGPADWLTGTLPDSLSALTDLTCVEHSWPWLQVPQEAVPPSAVGVPAPACPFSVSLVVRVCILAAPWFLAQHSCRAPSPVPCLHLPTCSTCSAARVWRHAPGLPSPHRLCAELRPPSPLPSQP